MRPLFFSQVCDFCDGLAAADVDWDLGFVIWQGRPLPTDAWVFATRDDAARWKRAEGLTVEPIIPVRAPLELRWRTNTRTLERITMTERRVTIFAHRRFSAAPNRAYLSLAETCLV